MKLFAVIFLTFTMLAQNSRAQNKNHYHTPQLNGVVLVPNEINTKPVAIRFQYWTTDRFSRQKINSYAVPLDKSGNFQIPAFDFNARPGDEFFSVYSDLIDTNGNSVFGMNRDVGLPLADFANQYLADYSKMVVFRYQSPYDLLITAYKNMNFGDYVARILNQPNVKKALEGKNYYWFMNGSIYSFVQLRYTLEERGFEFNSGDPQVSGCIFNNGIFDSPCVTSSSDLASQNKNSLKRIVDTSANKSAVLYMPSSYMVFKESPMANRVILRVLDQDGNELVYVPVGNWATVWQEWYRAISSGKSYSHFSLELQDPDKVPVIIRP